MRPHDHRAPRDLAASGRRPAAARVPALLRDRTFRRYWSGQTISMFGDQISSIALPLVGVLALHATPAEMGYLAALIWLPACCFGLHAGAWVDRRGHRRAMMIGADICRAALLTSIPVSYAFGVLTLWQLYAVAFGVGVVQHRVHGRQPDAVRVDRPRRQVRRGQFADLRQPRDLVRGRPERRRHAGPAADGAAGGARRRGVVPRLGLLPGQDPPAGAAGLQAGRRRADRRRAFIRHSPIVRASLLAASVVNFFNFVFFALFVLYATRYLHVQPGLLGLVLGVGSIGGVSAPR